MGSQYHGSGQCVYIAESMICSKRFLDLDFYVLTQCI